MNSCSSGYRSDTEVIAKPGDQGFLSRAPQPLWSGFLEAKSVYDSATSETRQLLVHECSLIYECNVCRNMFRSLTCFFKHKRLYCCQPFDHVRTNLPKGNNSQNANIKRQKQEPKENFEELGELILRVLKNEQTNKRHSSEETLVQKVQIESQCLAGRRVNFRRKTSQTNETRKCREGTQESIRDLEISKKVALKCEICERVFDTGKSLKIHKYKKHGLSKFSYQCPSCPLKFPQPTAVVQHLSSEHKKSVRCIKMMRDSIQKRRIVNDEITKSLEEPNFPQLRNKGGDAEGDVICSYCLKTFHRKALLVTHQNSCRLKNTHKSLNKCADDHRKKEETGLSQKNLSPHLSSSDVGERDINEVCFKPKGGNVTCTDTAQACALLEKCSIEDSMAVVTKDNHQKIKSKYLPCVCKICNKHFNALGNLRRHISMFHYRTRKFGCKLCEYRAFRKYDVINHLGHIHNILGDKESMTLEYIAIHEQQCSREDIDDDVILVSDDKKETLFQKEVDTSSSELNLSAISKRSERPNSTNRKKVLNPFLISTCLQKTIPRERSKLKRTISKLSSAPSLETRQKRPKRKRITPVEKDFVYDLSSILKSENAESEINRSAKRRDTVLQEAPSESTKEKQKLPFCKPLINCSIDLVKDASQKIALATVNQGRAAYASVPQLPTQRPQVRVRHTTIYRADFAAVPVIETSDLEEARSKIFDDRFLENLSKASTDDFKLKPGLAVLPQSTLNSLLKKVDLTLKNRMKDVRKKDEIKMTGEVETPLNGLSETDGNDSYSQLLCLQPERKDHVQLMECLVENKTENNESLLRFALEN